MAENKIITWEEVQKHKEDKNVWLVIQGRVYDVSEYEEHPGGYELLIDNAGYDATDAFEDNDHSQLAKERLETYFIGVIEEGEPPKREQANQTMPIILLMIVVGIMIGIALWH